MEPDSQITEMDMAQRMIEDQGNHECEVWAEGSEGYTQWNRCTKYPNHSGFIPIPEFSMNHLPWPHRDKDLIECLQVIGQLTVRLRVGCVSTERPDGYVFSNFRGKQITHTGTGMVSELLDSDIAIIEDDDEESDYLDDDEEKDDEHSTETEYDHEDANRQDAECDVFEDRDKNGEINEDKLDKGNREKQKLEDAGERQKTDRDNATVCVDDDKNRDAKNDGDVATRHGDEDGGDDSDDDGATDSAVKSYDNNPEGQQETPCPCPECESSSSPAQNWWTLHVLTATHVIYDSQEAKSTKVDIFYDDAKGIANMKTISGRALHGESETEDGCYLECVTHDKDLYDKMHHLCLQLSEIETKIFQKRRHKPQPPLCVIISHPHGCSKYVTVGEWVERLAKGRRYDCECTEYTYNTKTCNGSSGAPVFLLGDDSVENMTYTIHFHSSGLARGLNCSGVWIDPKYM